MAKKKRKGVPMKRKVLKKRRVRAAKPIKADDVQQVRGLNTLTYDSAYDIEYIPKQDESISSEIA